MFGIGVLVAPVESIVANAVPNPINNRNADWYYWWAGQIIVDEKGRKWSWDIRTGRRLRANYRLLVVFCNTINELALDVDFTSRTLWKMP